MLRITNPTREGTVWVTLEGNLAGPWVDECRDACSRVEASGRSFALDLIDVRFADVQGVRFLRQMVDAGVVLKNSRFMEELLRKDRSP